MTTTYTQNPPTVQAEQFAAAVTPWPDGVDDCGEIPGPHFHTLAGVVAPIADGDWIVTDGSGGRAVLDDATFRARYTLKA